jgi:hypothetical protein
MKALSLIVVVAVASLAAVTSASADTPVQTETTITVSVPNPARPYPVCSQYGYAFNATPTFTVTRRSTLFYDDAGVLVKEIRHVQFTGLVHKTTDLSVTIPYAASFTLVRDLTTDTDTITGLFRTSHPDGSGVIAMSAGRQVLSDATGELEDFNGNYAPTEWEQAACAYLASA